MSTFLAPDLIVQAKNHPCVSMQHDASGNWFVIGPNNALISTAGTTTQGLQEAINYATANGYNLEILGGSGTASSVINCTSNIVLPPMFMTEIKARGVTFNFGGSSNTGPCWFVNSMFMCVIDLKGCQSVNFGKGPCVTLSPTSNAPVDAQTVITACPYLHFGTLVNVHSPASDCDAVPLVKFAATNGPIVDNTCIEFQELNGSGMAIQVSDPGAGKVFARTVVRCENVHGQTGTAHPVIESGSAASVASVLENTWFIGAQINTASKRGMYEAGNRNKWFVNAFQAGVSSDYAFFLETTAANNIIIAGRLNGSGTNAPSDPNIILSGNNGNSAGVGNLGSNILICNGNVCVSQQVLMETTAPGTPPSGFVLYVKSADHKLYAKGSSGTETLLANP